MKQLTQLKLTAAAFALVFGGAAQAQSSWSWQMDPTPTPSTCTQPSPDNAYGNQSVCTSTSNSAGAGSASATVSAWSSAQGTLAGVANYGWHSAELTPQNTNGFGVGNRAEGLNASGSNGDHSVDTLNDGNYDFLMVSFTSAVILNQFGIGWGASDSDVTVMRWAGATGPSTVNGGNSLISTIGSGAWAHVGDYSNVCKDSSGNSISGNCSSTNSRQNTGANEASSYWLIAAYNTTMGEMDSWAGAGDGFKLNFLKATAFSCPTGTPNAGGGCGSTSTNVPEPGSLALVAAALLGVGYTRRRSQRAA